ncbi:MAG: hypothetical protein WC462_03185 [archaeon]
MMKKYFLNFKAQGTIEYLIILSVIIVIALIITVLFSSSFGFLFTNVNTTGPRISSSSGVIGIDGTVIDYQGNGLVGLGNNSNEDLIITRIRVNGVDTNYIDTVMLPGSEKIFSISNVSSGCSCEGFIGRQKSCEVIIYAKSESGVPRQFPVTVSVDCVQEVTSVNFNEVVLPESDPFLWAYQASLTFNVIDFNSSAHLIDVNMDCNVNAYDLNTQVSYFVIDFNVGDYSCVFYKSGYTSSTLSVVVPDLNAKPYVVTMFRPWYTAFIQIYEKGTVTPLSNVKAYCTGQYDLNSLGWPPKVDTNSGVNGDMNRNFFNGTHTCTFVKEGYYTTLSDAVIADTNANLTVEMEVVAALPPP